MLSASSCWAVMRARMAIRRSHSWRRDEKVASARVDSGDPFLANKTTQREVYDAARRAHPGMEDVLLINERGEVTEATLANVVAEIGGVRYTPPLTCGLLGGTFRGELLEAGLIQERVLMPIDIARASRLWLINSVREWIDVVLV